MSIKIFYGLAGLAFYIYAIACLFVGDIDGARYGIIACLLCSILQKEYET